MCVKNRSFFFQKQLAFPVGIFIFKVNNRNTRTENTEIYSKLTIKTPKQRQASFWAEQGGLIVAECIFLFSMSACLTYETL